jgi:hypothetical protein
VCAPEAADRRLASNLHNMDATWTSRPYHKNKNTTSFGTGCTNPGESISFSTPLVFPYNKQVQKLPSCPLSTRLSPFDKHYKYQLHICSYEHAHASTSTFNHPFAREDEIAVYSKQCLHSTFPISIFPFPSQLRSLP